MVSSFRCLDDARPDPLYGVFRMLWGWRLRCRSLGTSNDSLRRRLSQQTGLDAILDDAVCQCSVRRLKLLLAQLFGFASHHPFVERVEGHVGDLGSERKFLRIGDDFRNSRPKLPNEAPPEVDELVPLGGLLDAGGDRQDPQLPATAKPCE